MNEKVGHLGAGGDRFILGGVDQPTLWATLCLDRPPAIGGHDVDVFAWHGSFPDDPLPVRSRVSLRKKTLRAGVGG